MSREPDAPSVQLFSEEPEDEMSIYVDLWGPAFGIIQGENTVYVSTRIWDQFVKELIEAGNRLRLDGEWDV